ncbi:MAG: hypothetical protein PVF40_10655 [Ectothiorhodospiraceae bacterium]|jgi:hypothetical protein
MADLDPVSPTNPIRPVPEREENRRAPRREEKPRRRRRPEDGVTDDSGENRDDGPLVDDYA